MGAATSVGGRRCATDAIDGSTRESQSPSRTPCNRFRNGLGRIRHPAGLGAAHESREAEKLYRFAHGADQLALKTIRSRMGAARFQGSTSQLSSFRLTQRARMNGTRRRHGRGAARTQTCRTARPNWKGMPADEHGAGGRRPQRDRATPVLVSGPDGVQSLFGRKSQASCTRPSAHPPGFSTVN